MFPGSILRSLFLPRLTKEERVLDLVVAILMC